MLHYSRPGLLGHRGGLLQHGGARGDRHECQRWLRWATPLVVASLLSSYVTYLAVSSIHAGHHSFAANAPGAGGGGSGAPASGHGPHKQQQQQQQPAVAAAAGPPPAAAQHKYAPQDAAWRWVNATGRRMRVALVNHAPYHLEIVAGLLHVLGPLPVDVTWYQAAQVTPDGSLSTMQLLEVTGFAQMLGALPAVRPAASAPARCDFAVLVSPEYFEKETRAFLDAAKPVTAVVLAHNGMNGALKRIQAFHPRLHFSALSPHVAAAARHALKIQAHWMLPTYPFHSKTPCTVRSADAASCMDGFAVQGNFESARRNYTRLWRMVQQAMADGGVPTQPPARRFHLHLVGRGDVNTLKMPADVRNVSTVHFNLKFTEYYNQLQHSHALLMLLGNINYLTQKMSSTVVSSLMTRVPIVADAQVLASYTFLKPEHVFLMGPKETEMDAMQRVLRMTPAEVFAVHDKVDELAKQLNARSTLLLQAFMPLAEDAPSAPAVV